MKFLLSFIAALLPLGAPAQESASVQIRTLCFQRDASGISKLAVVPAGIPFFPDWKLLSSAIHLASAKCAA